MWVCVYKETIESWVKYYSKSQQDFSIKGCGKINGLFFMPHSEHKAENKLLLD